MQTTDLQKGYQELIKFFRILRTSLSASMKKYKFSGNIVENNMDYSYFQFTDAELKDRGLKIVIAFVHKDFVYEIWLSGVNRDIQSKFHLLLKNKKCNYEFSRDPSKIDFIIKDRLVDDVDYEKSDKLIETIEVNSEKFIKNVKDLIKP